MPIFAFKNSTKFTTTEIDYINPKLPRSFDEFVIVHVSDLHNKYFGPNQEKLIKEINILSPDIIAVTGDLLSKYINDIDRSIAFIENAAKIAPILYVSGNHEQRSPFTSRLMEILSESGVTILDDGRTSFFRGREYIDFIGLRDPSFDFGDHLRAEDKKTLSKKVCELTEKRNGFKIMLSHRPELLDIYAENEIDFVLTGHAHGGLFRFPLIGGLFAPNQGLFPRYITGMYKKANTSMIVSRGLGDSKIPIRFLNDPELISITLKSQ